MTQPNDKKILYKNYLDKLNHLDKYESWIRDLNDNLTNLKRYFNEHIFIHIQDFKDQQYDKLFTSESRFKKYMKETNKKPYSRKKAKKEGYKIFLRII